MGRRSRFKLSLAEGFEKTLSSSDTVSLVVGLLKERLVVVAERVNLETVRSWVAKAEDPTKSPCNKLIWTNTRTLNRIPSASTADSIEVRSYRGTYGQKAASELRGLAAWESTQSAGWEDQYAFAPWFEGGIPSHLVKNC
jgi:hypothetical protein